MNTQKQLTIGLAAALLGSGAALADADFVITGATAFRSAANQAIIDALDSDQSHVEVAYIDSEGFGSSDRTLIKVAAADAEDPSLDLDDDGFVIVKTSWSGSTGGIAAVASATPVQVLDDSTPTSLFSAGGTEATSPEYTTQVARFTFSDVTQASSTTTDPTLESEPGGVGVIPFAFVATEGAHDAGITSMTPQAFRALYGGDGTLPLSFFSGDPADEDITVYGIGRNNSSGTRATMLAETGFGVFNSVTQYDFWINPDSDELEIDFTNEGRPDDVSTGGLFVGTTGYSSSSYVRALLQGTAPDLDEDGDPDFYVIGYIDQKDVAAAELGGAEALAYAGESFSVDAVREGKYTLWNYEQFLWPAGLTTAEEAFKTDIVNGIDATLDETKFVKRSTMEVLRTGDGATVFPID
ncbi:MAG: hypothetical protein ACLFRP_01355 [Puniceicoccaceae bacterium]